MSSSLGMEILSLFSQTRIQPGLVWSVLHVGDDPDIAHEYLALLPLVVHVDANQSGQSGQMPSPHDGAPFSNSFLHVEQSEGQHDQQVVLTAV